MRGRYHAAIQPVLSLIHPGMAYVLTNAAGMQGPVGCDGTIVNAAGGLSSPLYCWHLQGEPLPNGLPPPQIGSIDDLNAVIQEQLNNISQPKHDRRGKGKGLGPN